MNIIWSGTKKRADSAVMKEIKEEKVPRRVDVCISLGQRVIMHDTFHTVPIRLLCYYLALLELCLLLSFFLPPLGPAAPAPIAAVYINLSRFLCECVCDAVTRV